jgi:beta-lactamase class A
MKTPPIAGLFRVVLGFQGCALLLGALLWMVPARAIAQEAHRATLSQRFQGQLEALRDTVDGVLGVTILDLESGNVYGVNHALVFPQASAIKISILVELYRQADAGLLRLDERLPIEAATAVGGAGILPFFGDGISHLALRDLAVLMIVLSDNTATNLLIERVGMEQVSRTMAELGFPAIRLQRRMIQTRESARGIENVATPADAAGLMERIYGCALPMEASLCADMRRILEIPRAGTLPSGVPSGVPLAWKSGSLEGVAVAWGIVDLPARPYVIAAMVNYGGGDSAGEALRQISSLAYAYFARLARSTPHGARVPLPILLEIRSGTLPP